MAFFKDVLRILIFSIVQTAILPVFLLPYGAIIIPYAFVLSFMFFFLPIIIIGFAMKFTFKKVSENKRYMLYGILAALICLTISIFFIATQRGKQEYFGDNAATYAQLIVATLFGFISWNFLSRVLLSELFLS